MYVIQAERKAAIRYWVFEYGIKRAAELAHENRWAHYMVNVETALFKSDVLKKQERIRLASAYMAGKLRKPMNPGRVTYYND